MIAGPTLPASTKVGPLLQHIVYIDGSFLPARQPRTTTFIEYLAIFISYGIAPDFRFSYLFDRTIKKDSSSIFGVTEEVMKTHSSQRTSMRV